MLKGIVKQRMEDDTKEAILSACSTELPAVVTSTQDSATSFLGKSDYGLMSAIQAAQRSFCITDPSLPDNPIVFASKGFLDLTGYKLEDVLGRNCRFLQGPGTDQAQVAKLRKGIQEAKDTSICLLNYRADGTPFYNQIFVAGLRDSSQKIINYVGVQVEIKPDQLGDLDGPEPDADVDEVKGREMKGTLKSKSRSRASSNATSSSNGSSFDARKPMVRANVSLNGSRSITSSGDSYGDDISADIPPMAPMGYKMKDNNMRLFGPGQFQFQNLNGMNGLSPFAMSGLPALYGSPHGDMKVSAGMNLGGVGPAMMTSSSPTYGSLPGPGQMGYPYQHPNPLMERGDLGAVFNYGAISGGNTSNNPNENNTSRGDGSGQGPGATLRTEYDQRAQLARMQQMQQQKTFSQLPNVPGRPGPGAPMGAGYAMGAARAQSVPEGVPLGTGFAPFMNGASSDFPTRPETSSPYEYQFDYTDLNNPSSELVAASTGAAMGTSSTADASAGNKAANANVKTNADYDQKKIWGP
jgi:PAS domain S-box-containing protein